jgi:hypothetical protein
LGSLQKEYEKYIYQSKTGNKWDKREEFVAKAGKYAIAATMEERGR